MNYAEGLKVSIRYLATREAEPHQDLIFDKLWRELRSRLQVTDLADEKTYALTLTFTLEEAS